jgi:hypothetical protein
MYVPGRGEGSLPCHAHCTSRQLTSMHVAVQQPACWSRHIWSIAVLSACLCSCCLPHLIYNQVCGRPPALQGLPAAGHAHQRLCRQRCSRQAVAAGSGGKCHTPLHCVQRIAAQRCNWVAIGIVVVQPTEPSHPPMLPSARPMPAKLLIVVPPRWQAASPVVPVTKIVSRGRDCRMWRRSSDLPVPAQPAGRRGGRGTCGGETAGTVRQLLLLLRQRWPVGGSAGGAAWPHFQACQCSSHMAPPTHPPTHL